MKIIQNNQSNTLLFVNSNSSFSNTITVRLRQLGGSGYTDIPVTDLLLDCFTASVSFNIPVDSLQNGSYILELLDILGDILLTSTVRVEGYNEENPRAYLVSDDTITSEQFILYPSQRITWSSTGLTFSNS